MKRKRTVAELQGLANLAIVRGQELRELRLLAAVTLERAAMWAHLSPTMIFNFESGATPVTHERYEALRGFYGAEIEERQARAAEIIGNKPVCEKGR